jgi:hypothetical protein
MKLTPRETYNEIPNYSLTGDLLAFHRCGLQYRLQNRGRLPPSTPVQLWFGGFIHGVMEEAYLSWREPSSDPRYRVFPWDYGLSHALQVMVDRTRLRPQNVIAPSNQFNPEPVQDQARSANLRAHEAVNLWGPHLFPLIDRPEIPLHGLRDMPETGHPRRADFFEISGIVDVLAATNMRALADNVLVRKLREALPPQDGDFEIIVDYKGTDRPEPSDELLRVYQWQLETYAWLRSRQEGARPVRAGILLFLTEVHPSRGVLGRLAERARLGEPIEGATAEDLEMLRNHRSDRPVPHLSEQLRMHRSLYILPLDSARAESGAGRFDQPVSLIEKAVALEMKGEPLSKAWVDTWRQLPTPDGGPRSAPDLKTCIACDHRTYCPIALETHGASAVGTIPKPFSEP